MKNIATLKAKFVQKKNTNTYLKGLSVVLDNHGRHCLLSFLCFFAYFIFALSRGRGYTFYDRANKSYYATPLTRCYVPNFLCPYIDSEVNHKHILSNSI